MTRAAGQPQWASPAPVPAPAHAHGPQLLLTFRAFLMPACLARVTHRVGARVPGRPVWPAGVHATQQGSAILKIPLSTGNSPPCGPSASVWIAGPSPREEGSVQVRATTCSPQPLGCRTGNAITCGSSRTRTCRVEKNHETIGNRDTLENGEAGHHSAGRTLAQDLAGCMQSAAPGYDRASRAVGAGESPRPA